MGQRNEALEGRALAAYERVREELESLREEDLVPSNVDAAFCVRLVLGSLPESRRYRQALAAQLPSFDIEVFDKLERYARALAHAHALCTEAFGSRDLRRRELALGRRQRVFTLLARAYDQLRRHLSFLRWSEGDVDEIAPSLYAFPARATPRTRAEPELLRARAVTLPSLPVPAKVTRVAARGR